MVTKTANQLFPRNAFVGFERMFEDLDRVARQATDTYPPHSIIKEGENDFLIELAVAGFAENELEVSVDERTLTVRGKHEDRGRQYIHKGISTKKFERKFRLSEYVEVTGAEIRDGILAIRLEVIVPESKMPKKIEIKKAAKPQLLTE